jgi:hypothetical protein
LEAEAQTRWLRNLGVYPSADELAFEFDDGFRLVPSFTERGWLNDGALPALAQLDDQLAAMSGEQNAELWHVAALASSAEWEHVRVPARAALILLA